MTSRLRHVLHWALLDVQMRARMPAHWSCWSTTMVLCVVVAPPRVSGVCSTLRVQVPFRGIAIANHGIPPTGQGMAARAVARAAGFGYSHGRSSSLTADSA